MNFHQALTRGYELKYEVTGQDRYEHLYFVDWDEPDNNDFLVVNQLTVEGANTRRPDLVIYVNGRHATYKVALALYVANVLGDSPEPALINVLLCKQKPNGGFTSLYDKTGTPVGDANTETTSLAIWALAHFVPGQSKQAVQGTSSSSLCEE